MRDEPQKIEQPCRRLVTERALEVENWFSNAELEFDDDDPTPPPIRGRPLSREKKAPLHLLDETNATNETDAVVVQIRT